MNRRPGHGTQNDPDDCQAGTEADAAATTAAIAMLRWRLRRQSTLEHPEVSSELRKLDEQITAQLARAERSRGRHRASPGSTPGQPGVEQADDAADTRVLATAPALQLPLAT